MFNRGGLRKDGGMDSKTGIAIAFALLILVALGLVLTFDQATPIKGNGSHFSNFASYVTMGTNGIDPEGLSIYWSQTAESCFVNDTLEVSSAGPNGPWSFWGNLSSPSEDSSVLFEITPGTTNWWTMFAYNCTGYQQGNVIEVSQPAAPALSISQSSDDNATLSWGNPATYGGGIVFGYYLVSESKDGGHYTAIANISAVGETDLSVTNLTPSSNYSFYVDTIDSAYGTYDYNASRTNVGYLNTSTQLTASANDYPEVADVNQSIEFSCAGSGGVSSLSYAWMFGDGLSGLGPQVSHQYSSPGKYTVTCRVTDSLGSTATSTITLVIDTAPSVKLTPSTSSVTLGRSLTLVGTASGGATPYSYNWTGLPTGCAPPAGAVLTCSPSVTGTFEVTLTVTDANGIHASADVKLIVNPGTTGISSAEYYSIIGGSLAVSAAILVVFCMLILRRRRIRRIRNQDPQAANSVPLALPSNR
jgi:PKD domain/Fibronectin type III domain